MLAALPRLWLAWDDQGVFWPDEIYQSLEPAHWFAFGYGTLVWEYTEGARSWLFAGVIGVYWKLLALLGVERAKTLVIAARLLMVAAAVAGVHGAMRLAQHHAGRSAAILAGCMAATCPVLLMFSHRCMPEIAAGALLVYAAWALAQRSVRGAVLAGVLTGIAVFLRYPDGIVLLGFMGWLAYDQRRDELRAFTLAALAVAAAGGLLDWVTWGAPFKSVGVYLSYNWLDQADVYGVESPWYFVTRTWTSLGPAALLLPLGWAFAPRQARGPLAAALAYALVHSVIAHKEMRFIVPIVPLVLAIAAAGLVRLAERAPAAARRLPQLAPLLGLVLAAVFAQRAAAITYGDLGQYLGDPAETTSPWHSGDGAHRLMWIAGEQEDLCGLWVTGIRLGWLGAQAFVHQDVPLLKIDDAAASRHANYAITPIVSPPFPIAVTYPAEIPPEYVPFARSRGWLLLRRPGECVAAPS